MPRNTIKLMLKMNLQILGKKFLTSGSHSSTMSEDISMGPPRASSSASCQSFKLIKYSPHYNDLKDNEGSFIKVLASY